MQVDPHPTGHELLGAQDVGVQVPAVAGEPFALIDQSCVFLRDRGFEARRLAVEHQLLECPMCRMQDDRCRRLVDLARLDPHEPILDHVDPADPVKATDPI